MIISTQAELHQYQELAKLSTHILRQLYDAVGVGVTPLQIDQLADRLISENRVQAAFKGVGQPHNLYQHATCISVNDAVVHGIPDQRPFQQGDLIKVDFGIKSAGLITDHCFSVGLAPMSSQDEKLLRVSLQAVKEAAQLARVGHTTGDLGFAQEMVILKGGCNVARGFIGHGIGHTMHDEPQLPAYGRRHTGQPLQEGMVLCIESQVLAGEDDLEQADDGWTITTKDGSKAGMFEVMVVVGKKRPLILTPTLDWPIIKQTKP